MVSSVLRLLYSSYYSGGKIFAYRSERENPLPWPIPLATPLAGLIGMAGTLQTLKGDDSKRKTATSG